jgi:dihydroorotate dehydrogenase (fumarate)
MADLSVSLCGIDLRNPFVVASGPLTWSAKGIHDAFAAGAAAAVTKTIRPVATVNPVPHIAAPGRGGSLLNTEGWSDFSAAEWLERELPLLRERDGVLIVSLGHTATEVEQLARPLADAGADILEVVSYRAQDAAPAVAAAKRALAGQAARVPVLIKVTANWPDLLPVVADCLAAGADGVTAIDSIGPTLRVDIEEGEPLLGSFAWLSGEAIRPISLRVVADICLRHKVPVVGTGGVGRAEDAVEMVMAGATAVGVHTAPLLRGLSWLGKTEAKLQRWLDARGHARLADLRGVALPSLQADEGDEPSHLEAPAPLSFDFDAEACTECGRCVTVCAYQARQLAPGPDMLLDTYECRSCGVCVTVCPTSALTIQHEERVP